MSSSPENRARSSEYERGWALLYRLIRLNGSLSGHERNVLYWNQGDGRFADLSAVAGLDFPEDGRAFVTLDFDRDGDLDILLNNRNSPQLRLLRNDFPTSHRSVSVRLEGTASNRDAVGARLVLETASGRRLTRTVRSGSGFRSQPSRATHFGLADEGQIRSLTVFWPSGAVDQHQGIPVDHFVSIKEGRPEIDVRPFRANTRSLIAPDPPQRDPDAPWTGIWLTEATPAPRLQGRTLDGERFPAERYQGKRMLLNFWATWCAPCRAELADFAEHREAFKDAGLVPVLISVDDPSDIEVVHRYMLDKQLPYPVLLPDSATVTGFDLLVRHVLDQSGELAIPTTFLVDESGRIVKLYRGRTTAGQILEDARNWPSGETDSLERALPFSGRAYVTRFERNWTQLADAYAAAGLRGEAVAALEHALQVHPEHPAIVDRLGSLYAEQGRWQDALHAHRRALEFGLPGLGPRLRVATALAELGRLPEAGAAASDALAQAPDDIDALRVWGAIASRLGNFEEALPALLSVERLDGDNPEIHYNLGWLYLQTGRRREAAASLGRATQLDPGHVRALHDLGILHAQGGSWDEAAKALRQALDAQPDFPEAHYSLGLVFAQRGDFQRAEESLQAAIELRGDYAEALTDLAGVYIQTRRFREALPLLARARQANPALGQAYLNAAKAHLALDDRTGARAALEAWLAIRPGDPDALALRDALETLRPSP